MIGTTGRFTVMVLVLSFSGGCFQSSQSTREQAAVSPGASSSASGLMLGTVSKGVEAGCWMIEVEGSGEVLNPINLEEKYRVVGTKLKFAYQPEMVMGICMQGKGVRLTNVTPGS